MGWRWRHLQRQRRERKRGKVQVDNWTLKEHNQRQIS